MSYFRRSIPFKHTRFNVKGLTTSTIREPAVPLSLGEKVFGNFQVVECYEGFPEGNPLLIADIIANNFFRLSYLIDSKRSATLGTSIVASPSFRTTDGVLHYIPTAQSATIAHGAADGITISNVGRFANDASVSVSRNFHCCDANIIHVEVNVTLTIENRIVLDTTKRMTDTFRLLTISSMFSGDRYDANAVEISDLHGHCERHRLTAETARNSNLFTRSVPSNGGFKVVKEAGSVGAPYTPGSPDSPSIFIEATSVHGMELGVQGYLDSSTDVNDDSLTVWLEWRNCPDILEQGQVIKYSFNASAYQET